MRWSLALAFAAIVGAARAQEATLVERTERGLRRTAVVVRKASARLESKVLEETVSSFEPAASQEATVHDWHLAPGRVLRTWETLRTVSSSRTKVAFMDQVLSSEEPVLDQRAGQSVLLEVGPDGRGRIAGGADRIVQEADRRAVESEFETALLPAGPVAVGDRWAIPLDRVEDPFAVDLGFPVEFGAAGVRQNERQGGALEASLERLDAEGGRAIATIAFQGRLEYRRLRKVPYLETVESDTTTRYEIAGRARLDATGGRWLARETTARFERSATAPADGRTEAVGTGLLEDRRTYSYGWIFDESPAGIAPDPTEVEAPLAPVRGPVPPGELVIGRNFEKGSVLATFDPAAGREVARLAVLPPGARVDHASLDPAGARVAFASTLNNDVSHAEWNVFVLDLAAGRLDQVTPEWAPGHGIAPPLSTEETGSVRGSVTWYDSVRQRHFTAVLSGMVHADRTRCRAALEPGGGFLLAGVPAAPLVLQIQAKVSHGEGGLRETVTMGAYVLATVRPGETTDLGAVAIHAPFTWFVHSQPTWVEGGLRGTNYLTDFVFEAGYPERRFELGQLLGALGSSPGGFAADPRSDRLALFDDPTGPSRVRFFDAVTRREALALERPEEGFQFDPHSRGCWTPDGARWVAGGHSMGALAPVLPDVPSLVAADPERRELRVVKKWPELAGLGVEDVAVDPAGAVYYLVLRRPAAEGAAETSDLWSWDSTTDVTRRLTGWGNVVAVSVAGR